jgi:hypothetical protein
MTELSSSEPMAPAKPKRLTEKPDAVETPKPDLVVDPGPNQLLAVEEQLGVGLSRSPGCGGGDSRASPRGLRDTGD